MKTVYIIPVNQPQPQSTYHQYYIAFKDLSRLLLLDCLKACQGDLIGNIRFLTFSFITTTLHYVIKEKDIST